MPFVIFTVYGLPAIVNVAFPSVSRLPNSSVTLIGTLISWEYFTLTSVGLIMELCNTFVELLASAKLKSSSYALTVLLNRPPNSEVNLTIISRVSPMVMTLTYLKISLPETTLWLHAEEFTSPT